MYDTVLKTFIRLRYSDEGAALVEYGIAFSLAILIGGGAFVALGTGVTGSVDAATAALPS